MDSNTNQIKLELLAKKVQDELKKAQTTGLIPEFKDMEKRLKEFMAELKFEPEKGKEFTVKNLARVVFPLMRNFAMGGEILPLDELEAEIGEGFELKFELKANNQNEVAQVLSPTSSRRLLAQDLYNLLRTIPVNSVVTYRHMESTINHKIRGGSDFMILKLARVWARERDGLVFETITRVGLKRLSDSAKLNETVKYKKRIHRTATDAATTLITVEYENLTPAEQKQFAIDVSWAGAIRMISGSDANKKALEHYEEESPRKQGFDPARTLALFGQKPE